MNVATKPELNKDLILGHLLNNPVQINASNLQINGRWWCILLLKQEI